MQFIVAHDPVDQPVAACDDQLAQAIVAALRDDSTASRNRRSDWAAAWAHAAARSHIAVNREQ
jgi:hypothetical protein